MLQKSLLAFSIVTCLLLWGLALESEKKQKERKGTVKITRNKQSGKESTARRNSTRLRNDLLCTNSGGICQKHTFICPGRYLQNRCSRGKTYQCCMPEASWSVLCANSHHNRVRGCDRFGCGVFNSKRDGTIHKAVDIVCDDYGVINAPFSGRLGGPVGRKVGGIFNHDGIKLFNSEYCINIFNIRPYRYSWPIRQGEALGYLLPLQDSFSGITSHLELQMCDQSDPTPFI